MRRDFYDRGREETVAGAAPIGGSAGTGSGQGTKRRLIQEGAILEKVLPEVQTIELSELEGYLSRKLGKQI